MDIFAVMIKVLETSIPGVVIIEPAVHGDARGYFMESWSERDFAAAVRPVKFVQDNESMSSYGVLRGLHYQKGIHTQSKLIRVVSGRVLDVAVDIRRGSPTFGKHVSVELSGDNHRQVFIPKGFAHGFVVLSPEAVFQYKCDAFYAPEADAGIAGTTPPSPLTGSSRPPTSASLPRTRRTLSLPMSLNSLTILQIITRSESIGNRSMRTTWPHHRLHGWRASGA